jgi:TonB family protein
MLKNIPLLLILFISISKCVAAIPADTLFYDINWKETSNKSSATYYRVMEKDKGAFKISYHYVNGKIYMTGAFSSLKPDKRDGKFIRYDENGRVSSEKTYQNNKLNGPYRSYYPDGRLKYDASYKEDALDGEFRGYYSSGQLKRIDNYKKGTFLSGKCFTKSGRDTTYSEYLKGPSFVGGQESLVEYIRINTQYPDAARRRNIEGMVKVRFVVDTLGKVTNVTLYAGVDPLLNEQALYLVRNMPDWIPGSVDDEPENLTMLLPIVFNLKNK